MDAINGLDRVAFVAIFGSFFEHPARGSPSAASRGRAVRRRRAALHATMVATGSKSAAPAPERPLALIRAHPDLAGKAAIAGELGPESRASRPRRASTASRPGSSRRSRGSPPPTASACPSGFPLRRLRPRARRWENINRRGATAAWLADPAAEEPRTALAEIAKIARLRLADLVDDAA